MWVVLHPSPARRAYNVPQNSYVVGRSLPPSQKNLSHTLPQYLQGVGWKPVNKNYKPVWSVKPAIVIPRPWLSFSNFTSNTPIVGDDSGWKRQKLRGSREFTTQIWQLSGFNKSQMMHLSCCSVSVLHVLLYVNMTSNRVAKRCNVFASATFSNCYYYTGWAKENKLPDSILTKVSV